MVEKIIRDNTAVNNLKDLLDEIDAGYDAITSLAIKQPGQGNEEQVRHSNVYQIEVADQGAFDVKCDIDRILATARGELQFVANCLDRYFKNRDKKCWTEAEVKRSLAKKAKVS